MKTQIGAIILAAGASRRLGQPKQLLAHGGETMIERVIRLANEAGASPVIAVLGAHSALIAQAVPINGAVVAIPVMNDRWKEGIATSIHAGLRALDVVAPKAAGAMILGCDQPRLTAGHLRALMEVFSEQVEPAIAASAYAGTSGIPAVFPREVFAELRGLSGDKGARGLLMKPPCLLVAVEFAGGEIDIDLPADLAQLE
jgi:CTP:molybdopterin cytidylyltransferase MocA